MQRTQPLTATILAAASFTLLFGVTIQAPTADALAWTSGCFRYGTGPDAAKCQLQAGGGYQISDVDLLAFDANHVYVWYWRSGTQLQYSSGNAFGGTGSAAAFDAVNNNVGGGFTAEKYGSLDGYLCWSDGQNRDLRFSYTHDGGIGFSAPVTIASTGLVGDYCAVWAAGPNIVVVAYYDGSNAKWATLKSTNGGATFAAPVDLKTSCNNVGDSGRGAGTSATSGFFVFPCNSGGLQTCQTTDGAATWTNCYQTGVTGTVSSWQSTSGSSFVAGLENTGPMKALVTSDGGGTYSTRTLPGDTVNPGTTTILAFTPTYWGAFACSSPTTTVGLRAAYSSDAGQSWGSYEDGLTLTSVIASTISGGCMGSGRDAQAVVDASGQVWFVGNYGVNNGGFAGTSLQYSRASSVAPPPVGASAETTTVANLVAMTIDPSGRLLVARTDNGEYVRSYNAQNLALGATGSFDAVNCASNPRPGIMAEFPNVAFLDCGTNHNFNALRIRNNQLLDPDVPSDDGGTCPTNEGDACAKDYGPSGGNGDYGQFPNLVEVNTFDQTFGLNLLGTAHRAPDCATKRQYEDTHHALGNPYCGWENFLWWTFSTTTGKLGVDTLVAKDGAIADRRHEYTVQYAPSTSTSINHLCTSTAPGPGTYIVGAQPSTPAQEYRLSFTRTEGDILDTDLVLNLASNQIPQQWSGSGVNYGAQGVACRNDRVLLYNPNFATQKIMAFKPSDGSFLYSIDLAGNGGDRGIATARDRGFGAFVDGANFKVFNTTSGAITGTWALPVGAFKDIRMDAGAQSVFIGTSTRIERYVVFTATTGAAAPILPDSGPRCNENQFICITTPGVTPAPSGGIMARGTGAVGRFVIGAGNPWVSLTLSLLTILAPAALAFKMTGGGVNRGRFQPGSPLLISVASFFGMCLAVVAFDFPFWIPLLTAVVAVALIVNRFWVQHRTGGD